MGVVTTTIYASEAFSPMSFCGKNLNDIYVPFVFHSAALSEGAAGRYRIFFPVIRTEQGRRRSRHLFATGTLED